MENLLLILFGVGVLVFPVSQLWSFVRLVRVHRLADPCHPPRQMHLWWLLATTSILLILSVLLDASDWQGDKGLGWLGSINEDGAGTALLPLWFVAAAMLGRGLLRSESDYQWPEILAVATLWLVCGWYIFSLLFLKTLSPPNPIRISDIPQRFGGDWTLLLVPCPAFVNLSLLLTHLLRHRAKPRPHWGLVAIWLASIGGTIWWKIIAAQQHFLSLPTEPPPMDNCFIVTAAARGHEGFVGSQFNSRTGRPENLQLHRMRAMEALLMAHAPGFHRRLRRVYGVIGPAVARRIRRPWQADAVYVLLKPIEWVACAAVKLAGR